MYQRGKALKGWQGARLAGVAAVVVTSVLAAGAAAAPGGQKGKPESKPNASQGTEKTSGGGNAYGHSQGATPAPEPTPAPQSEPESQGQTKAKAPKPATEPSVEAKADPPSSGGKGNTPGATKKSSGDTTKTASGPKKSQNAGTGDNPQGRGPSGKTQYCHATHSGTNPYVLIETNNNGLPAHRRHQDEEDIIPAQSGDCPGGSARGQSGGPNGGQQPSKAGGPDGKATYCHSTRSETNPFVVITTSVNALAAHIRHHTGDDIIPPETGDCSGAGGQSGGQQHPNAGGPDGKATYCHSTRSDTNPFVVITTSVNALAAHIRHHTGDDIIPAVNGQCPGGQAPTQQTTDRGVDETPTAPNGQGPNNQRPNTPAGPEGNANGPDGLEGDDPTDEARQRPAGSDDGDAPGDERVSDRRTGGDDGPAQSDVLAENEAGGPGQAGPDEEGAAPLAEETAGASDGDDPLPFTGLGVLAILAVALMALAGGAAARRATRSTDT